MSTSLILGAVGAVIGGYLGGGAGASAGYAIGSAIGGAVDPPTGPDQVGPRLGELRVQNSAYGAMIPIVYGGYRVAGNVIWQQDIQEHKHEEEVGKGGGATNTTYTYSCSFAVSICEGPITSVRRIWADNKLVYDINNEYSAFSSGFTFSSHKFYLGDEDQMPDPTMESLIGIGNVPGYRGQAYFVVSDLELANHGNRIPALSFEVLKEGTTTETQTVTQYPYTSIASYTGVYNPVRNELWVAGFGNTLERRSPVDGTVLGTIPFSSQAAGMESGYLAGPIYDPIYGYIYWGSYSSRKILRFSAADATLLTAITWASGTTDGFSVSPLTGNVWRTAIVSGVPRLQERNPSTGADGVNVALTGLDTSGRILFDGAGNIWVFRLTELRRYSPTGVLNFTYTAPHNIHHAVYDRHRNSMWISIDYGTATTYRNITGITRGNPTLVTYAAGSGTGFQNGQAVTVYNTTGTEALWDGPTGDRHIATVVDSNTVSLDVDSTDFTAWVSGGQIFTGTNYIRELSLTSLTVTKTILQHSRSSEWQFGLLYDAARKIIWACDGDYSTNLVGIDTDTGEVLHEIVVSPFYDTGWVVIINNDLWYVDESEENLYRVHLGGTVVSSEVTYGSVVRDISLRCPLTEDQIDVAQLTDTLKGFAITSKVSARASIEQLMNGDMFDSVDSDGKVKFVKRGGVSVATISTNDMVDSQ